MQSSAGSSNGYYLAEQADRLIRASRYHEAFQLAARARDADEFCTTAYMAEGLALLGLNKPDEALAAIAEGIANCPSDIHILRTMIKVAKECPLKNELRGNIQRLEQKNLADNPFLVLSMIGQDLHRAKHHQAAIDVLECALDLNAPSFKLRGTVLNSLGAAYWAVGERESATSKMKEELILSRENADIEGEIRALGSLAAAARESGRLSESISCLREQIRASRSLPDVQSSAAELLAQLTNTEMALQTLEKFSAKAATFLLFSQRRSDKAEKRDSLRRAIAAAERFKEEDLLIQSLLKLGQVLLELKLHGDAIVRVERAKLLLAKHQTTGNKQQLLLDACATLCTCYRAVREHSKAAQVARKGAELSQKLNNPDVEFHCLGEEGRAYQDLGNHEKALASFTSQRELLSPSSYPIAWADCLLGIVDCLDSLSKKAEAKSVAQELAHKCEREYNLQIRVYRRLSRLHADENCLDLAAAIKSTESLLYAAIKEADTEVEWEAYHSLGQFHMRLGQLQQAESCLERAKRMDQDKSKAIDIDLAYIAFQLKNFDKARTILRHHHTNEAFNILAQIEEESDNCQVAVDLYKGIIDSTQNLSLKDACTSKLARCLQKMNLHDEAVSTLRNVVKKSGGETDSVVSDATLNKTATTTATISSIHSTGSSTAEQLHLTLAESLAAIGNIEEALEEAEHAGETGTSLRELLLVREKKLTEALHERVSDPKPGLHFSLCRLDLHCWLVNDYQQVIAFCGHSKASDHLVRLRNIMLRDLSPRMDISDQSMDSTDDNFTLQSASVYLYEALIGAFEAELVRGQSLEIYCHDDRLLSVPWSCLTGDDKIPLVEKYKIAVVPTALDMKPASPEAGVKLLQIQSLETQSEPNSKDEGFPQSVISNLAELKNALTKEKHVWLSLDIRSELELCLSEERHDVFNLFSTGELSNLSMVILDSDNTGPLADVLIKAGVSSVIRPLWKVPKIAVSDFVRLLNESLESMDPISALQDAQLKQKSGKKFVDTSFWGAWIGTGIPKSGPNASITDALYGLLRSEPSRARRTLLQVQLGEKTLSEEDESLVDDFTALVPSLLAIPVDCLSALVPILPRRRLLGEIKRQLKSSDKSRIDIDMCSWAAGGCHDFLQKMGFGVVEMSAEKVSLQGGKSEIVEIVHRALTQMLNSTDKSASQSPDETSLELIENSPVVSEPSNTSPLRHSDASPFRIVQRKAKSLNDTMDSALGPESIKSPDLNLTPSKRRVIEVTGRSSLPLVQHKFRSLWIGSDPLRPRCEEDQSSGFGSGQNKTLSETL